ncbi:MAG: tight adherence protein [Thermomicrobiales bacterium]|jgi:tight adherence protein C|nr:tight adherence protein [Thermomicrobiales bacterium]
MSPQLVGAFVLLMGAGLILVGLSRRKPAVNIEERLATFADRPLSLEHQDLERPFSERVLKPIIKGWAVKIGSRSPSQAHEKTRNLLAQAGNPSGLGPAEFLGLKALLAVALGGGSFVLFTLSQMSPPLNMVIPLVLAFFGYMLPGIWLKREIKARKKEITKALPDAIDLLTISVESGLGFDPALMRVAEKWDNHLSREFSRVLSEMRIGKSKREALREMSQRVDEDGLTAFVSAVVQADQLGVAITQVLRIQSEAMRIRRRQRAQELAQKAPIKMLFPMAFLIFPALYVVILGPSVPRIVEAFK